MRLIPILIGMLLLATGLGLYYGIPNTHNIDTTLSRNLTGPQQLVVEGGAQRVLNVTLQQNAVDRARLEANVTVRTASGLSQLKFRVSSISNANSCFPAEQASACAYNDLVSNSTIDVPLTSSSPVLYVIFDNTAWTEEKIVNYNVALKQDQASQSVSYDGISNWFGISLVVLGSISVFYGFARKNVIPWE